jgi:hypothetical protein
MQNKNLKPQMKALELINNSSNEWKKNICINSNPKHKAWKNKNRKGEELILYMRLGFYDMEPPWHTFMEQEFPPFETPSKTNPNLCLNLVGGKVFFQGRKVRIHIINN